MGAVSGAFAAAATTPLDVIKTRMMCTAATRPSMRSAAAKVWTQVRAASEAAVSNSPENDRDRLLNPQAC